MGTNFHSFPDGVEANPSTNHGGSRMAESNHYDANCKAHDLDNLYVVDGSFFVSSSAVNPALTIMANALRVGEHLIQRMKGN
jgi:choline dehydrogenase-like flavoprotein